MSELEQLKQSIQQMVEEQTSPESLAEIREHLLHLKASQPIEISEEGRERLDQAEAYSRTGNYSSVEEVRARMEAKYPFLKKEGE